MIFPPDFQAINISVSSSITIHGVRGGSGPPLVLIHGYPQTHAMWNQVAPRLSTHYTVIALDLRGYGRSSKPVASKENPDDHSLYSKSAMANDVSLVMKSLGFDRYFVCGHDRGARVAHALDISHPSEVIALMLLDICPTLTMYNQTSQEFASLYWHWFFLIQPAPFPENAITSAPAIFADKQMGAGRILGGGKHVMGEEPWAEYEAQLCDWNCVHAMCEDYRAAAKEDLEEQKNDMEQGRKVRAKTRVLWGKRGVIERLFDARREWAQVIEEGKLDVQGSYAMDCGHYIPEEKPEELTENILEFLKE